MLKDLALDYSNYFRTDLESEIIPICTTVEEMLTRLEEFESVLTNVKISSQSVIKMNLEEILPSKRELEMLCNRIDNLELLVNSIESNLLELENTVTIAQDELQVANYSLKYLLKPFLVKNKENEERATNLKQGEFQKPEIFNSSKFFEKIVETE